jgi:alanine-glyoxylate transaminase/serine-glyoxylate transaminase/serine-pyruvate transaminase
MGYSSRIENVVLCLGALETVLSDMGMKVEQGAAESAAHYAYAANPLPVESKSAAKAA